MNKKIILSVALVFGVLTTQAADYFVNPELSSAEVGSTVTYKERKFVVGQTAFASFAEFNVASPEANSSLYVAPGTYSENVTFTTTGLNVLGSNAYRDWTVTRATETEFTGVMNLNADNITVNGFKFTGTGRISAKAGTNESPQSGITVKYNYFTGSTLARDKGKPLVAIGTRYTNEKANDVISQQQYSGSVVAHNYFEGSSTHIANSIVLAGVYGTTSVTDNYFYDGGTSIHIDNGQGNININHNVFKNVGVTTSTAPDGGSKGDFCVYAMRCGYANTTTVNICDNEFDGCYGQASYFSLIRVYPGSSGSTNCVIPVGMSVNINHNTFKNKTSVATNSNQLGENMLLYSDKSTTGDVDYNLADNHFDNRFYKFSYVTLADGLGQRQVYSNTYDQFVFGSSYSTMGTSIITGTDISNHSKNTTLASATVLQSMDIDMATGDMYFLQLLGNSENSSFCSSYGLNSSTCDALRLTRVICTKKGTASNPTYTYSGTQSMRIAKSGHGVKLSVCRDKNGQLWMITGGRGDDNGTSNDLSGIYVSRFKFVSGGVRILDGSGETDSSVKYTKHPKEYKNAYAAVDEVNRYVCFSTSGNGRKYYIYDLDDYLEGNELKLIKKVTLKNGNDPITGTGLSQDNGFCTWSYQSYDINGDYLYFLEGESQDTSKPVTSGDPVVVISTYNWRTGQYLLRTRVNYGRINDTFGEPEAFTIRPDEYGNVSAYLGIAVGSSGARKASIFKYHVDRHIDDSGNVIGVDTSTGMKHFKTAQYSGITMTTSADEFSLTASDTTERPTQKLTITNAGEYLYGAWTGTITGEDGDVFDVKISSNTPFSSKFTATVTFKPDGLKSNYSAYLRLHSPLAGSGTESADIVIPITATYTEVGEEPTPTPNPEYTLNDDVSKMTEVWNYGGNTTQPSWLNITSSGTTRFIAENAGNLYVLNCSPWGTPEINIIDAYNGEDSGNDVNIEGVEASDVLTPISSIRFVDGVLVGASAANANHTFRVYAWKNGVTSSPTKILEDATHGGLVMGSNISISGDLNKGYIWATDDTVKHVIRYAIADGVVNTTPEVIALTKNGEPMKLYGSRGAGEVIPNEDGTFWVVGQSAYPILFNSDGTYNMEMQSGALNNNNHGTAMKFFTFGNKKYVAAVSYTETGQANGYFTLIDVTDGIADASTYKCKYPEAGLGATANGQNISSICQSTREDGMTLDIWVCCALQGVAHYTYNGKEPTSIDDVDINAREMTIVNNGERIVVNGVEVSQIRLYTMSGALVRSTDSNEMEISGKKGLYVLVVNDKDGTQKATKVILK